MKYLSDRERQEFVLILHPATREAILELDAWSQREKLPEPVVVCIHRTEAENAAIGGSPRSWHLLSCAADLRTHHYSAPELAAVEAWVRARCFGSQWEVITQLHGTGPHIHLAYRDFARRRITTKGAPNA